MTEEEHGDGMPILAIRERQLGDYAFEPPISREDCSEDIRAAETVVSAVETRLKEENVL